MVILGRNPLTGEQEFFVNKEAAKLSGAIDIEEVEGQGVEEDEVVEVTTGVPPESAGLAELASAESKALDIIQNFLKTFEGSNIYGDDDDDEDDDPKFEEQTQTYNPTKDDAAALYPYFPSNILDELIMKWTETGSIDIALATVRSGDAYAKAFPGIRREDGSLRMQEIQYL